MTHAAPARLDGRSPALRALRATLERYARAEVPVLIRGETGVGKDVAARTLHALSPRRAAPLIAVNCGGIPRELLEAELFGTAAGAFTGARDRAGLLQRAHGGTLFLDELGDLPGTAQVVLLRVLEERRVWPIGGAGSIACDFRLVSATHRDLDSMIARGRFRADLYHRLATLVVDVPPLRARLDDLPELARELVGAEVDRLRPSAWARLHAHAWPGNIRELRNVLLRALASRDGPITAHDLDLRTPPVATASSTPDGSLARQIGLLVRRAVAAHGGNVRAAARALAVSPTTVYRYLRMDAARAD